MTADPGKMRTLRIGVLGPQTARCETCLADCSKSVGEWVVTGMCASCFERPRQQRIAGR